MLDKLSDTKYHSSGHCAQKLVWHFSQLYSQSNKSYNPSSLQKPLLDSIYAFGSSVCLGLRSSSGVSISFCNTPFLLPWTLTFIYHMLPRSLYPFLHAGYFPLSATGFAKLPVSISTLSAVSVFTCVSVASHMDYCRFLLLTLLSVSWANNLNCDTLTLVSLTNTGLYFLLVPLPYPKSALLLFSCSSLPFPIGYKQSVDVSQQLVGRYRCGSGL